MLLKEPCISKNILKLGANSSNPQYFNKESSRCLHNNNKQEASLNSVKSSCCYITINFDNILVTFFDYRKALLLLEKYTKRKH